MKIENETLKIGTRFYRFIDDEEYEIFVLVKSEEDTGKFMNEETFEIVDITQQELIDEYTMLSNSIPFMVLEYHAEDNVSLFIHNQNIKAFKNSDYAEQFKVGFFIDMNVYRFMTKAVFNKTFNYILSLNNLFHPLSESDIDFIWGMYFLYMSAEQYVMRINPERVNMEDVVNNNAKIPDSVFMYAEDYLNTYILSYEAYQLDDSVNIDNVNMKYFIMYDYVNDKYYIILYVIDTARVSREQIKLMNENMDVVEFMLG